MRLVVIDCDYTFNKNQEPVIRIYGKKVGGSVESEDVVLHVRNFEPYFYCLGEGIRISEINEVLGGYVKRVEKVKRFLPIGYQSEKVDMFKITLKNPRVTPECRKMLSEGLGDRVEGIYEADILFKNRYLIDSGIDGMSVIEFNEIGKGISNYGLNCNELYIVDMNEIRMTDEKVDFEY